MSNETEDWTYTSEDKTYAVGKFTEEGRLAFILLFETDKEIQATRKALAKLEMAVKGFNATVLDQLTEDMIVVEEKEE
tara:strand:+ start:118 stop:351 length:234 start_codon:yes stop_codon:yes gene_type:complete